MERNLVRSADHVGIRRPVFWTGYRLRSFPAVRIAGAWLDSLSH